MPSSGAFKFTLAVLFSFNCMFASRRSPVDLTLTKILLFKSLLSVSKFIFFNKISFLPNFSFGPTKISFLSELILITYKASLSETFIPFLWPILKFIIP